MKGLQKLTAFIFMIISINYGYSQGISGNMSATYQYLLNDSKINALQPDEKSLLNTYMDVNYRLHGFKAGVRFEGYLPHIAGYPDRFDGMGLGRKYIGYENKLIDITLGNFYEQFGSGLLFRSYVDHNLGVDNMMNGLNINLRPYKGITLKTVYGKQRYSFEDGRVKYGSGIIRGADLTVNFSQVFPTLYSKQIYITAGGSFVSKYQEDNNTQYVLPENTAAWAGRLKLGYKGFYIDGEYVFKSQDPSEDNGYIYNYGHGMVVNMGYSQKGLGIVLSAKSIDNMSFRSDRTAILQDLSINYIPSLTKIHTYNLVATLYPYVSQPNGEVAFQADIMYTIPRGSALGGKYGTQLALNFSTAYAPIHHTSSINSLDSSRVMYTSRLFDKSDNLYWRDINFQVKKKINRNWMIKASYFNIALNNDVVKITDEKGIIQSHIGVVELQYKINRRNTIRAELQGLWTVNRKDRGDWATLLLEYTISPKWFFSFVFQSNYGNPNKADRVNYPMVFVGRIWKSTRVQLGYGRQKAGLFCVGGVCRFVPASNGLTVTVAHSF